MTVEINQLAAMASQWLWTCAWGKDGGNRIKDVEAPTVTIEQRRDEAMATLQAAFERVLQASRGHKAAEQDGSEDGTDAVDAVIVEQDQRLRANVRG